MQKIITKFYFDRARYLVGDGLGSDVYLRINYKNGNYNLLGRPSNQLKMQIDIVATNLIKKKHGVNFSDSIKV